MSQPAHLTRLNPEQYDAVTTTEGPLLILAGAGSGKTRVLTRRIAHLLHNGVEPQTILAVTFTRKAAHEMKERVAELVGEAGAKVWVNTFHATCCRILRQSIEPLGWSRKFTIYDDDDQIRMIKNLMADLDIDADRVEAKAIIGKIDWAKNRMLDPDALLAQKRAHDNEAWIRVWRRYEEALKAADAVDFNDLIGLTIRLFKEHPEVLSKWQSTFQYVLVDEYQDTNRAQYALLRQLVDRHGNIAVVGDDDQSIYGFRGADISIILGFKNDFPNAKIIALEQNYRCSGNILDVANTVIAKNTGRMDKKLWTEAAKGAKVQVLVAPNPTMEARGVARKIFDLRRAGVNYGDICVIYRTNAMSRPFEQSLRDNNIPHKVVGGRKFYERREVRDILGYLRLLVNPADDAALLRVINVPPRGIGAKGLGSLREEALRRGDPLLKTAQALAQGEGGKAKGFGPFVAIVAELTDLARDIDPGLLVRTIIDRSGYRAMLEADKVPDKDRLTDESADRLANLAELERAARQYSHEHLTATPFERLQAWLDTMVLAGKDEQIPEGGEVTLMTAHNAKGLEYPYVFVVQMMDGLFPHARALEEGGLEEERRLAYVAFTRAMKELFITRSERGMTSGESGESEMPPSPFLYGLPGDSVAGTIPEATPAGARQAPAPVTPKADQERKLNAFVRQHQRSQAEQKPNPDDELMEVEDPSVLRRDSRVWHRRAGYGHVLKISQAGVLVALDRGGSLTISWAEGPIHLVTESPG